MTHVPKVRVQKYGGSSVATLDKLQTIARRAAELQAAGQPLVLVVSAMGGQTDHLLGLARGISDNPSRRELDMLLSVGERISMALLSMAIHEAGGRAISFTGSQCGIITNTEHRRAHIVEVRPQRIFEALDEGLVVIVAGFQGVSIEKEVTTLGRGGSDTTAVALAAALGAESAEIYSDVDGVYDADPRIVSEAAKVDAIAAGEMLELGLSGAKVLAAEAVDYARRHGIRIHARSSFQPGTGTVITDGPLPGQGHARAVTGDRNHLLLRARGPGQDLDRLAAALLEAGSSWKYVHRDGDRWNGVLDLRDEDGRAAALDRLQALPEAQDLELEAVEDAGVVTLVGTGIHEQGAVWRRAIALMQGESIALTGHWVTPFGLHLVVGLDRVDDTVRTLHDHFLASELAPEAPSDEDPRHDS